MPTMVDSSNKTVVYMNVRPLKEDGKEVGQQIEVSYPKEDGSGRDVVKLTTGQTTPENCQKAIALARQVADRSSLPEGDKALYSDALATMCNTSISFESSVDMVVDATPTPPTETPTPPSVDVTQ